MFGSVSGHISRVLKAENVSVRPRGKKVNPVAFEKFPDAWKEAMESDVRKRAKEISDLHKNKTKRSEVVGTRGIDAKGIPEKSSTDGKTKKGIDDLTNEDVMNMATTLLKDWIGSTVLKSVKFDKKERRAGSERVKAGKASAYTSYENTKNIFDWYMDDDSGDSDALVVDDSCKNFKSVEGYGRLKEREMKSKYPRLRVEYLVDGVQGSLAVSVQIHIQ